MAVVYEATASGGMAWVEVKDPSDVKSYSLNILTWLNGDTVSGTPTATAEDTGITVDSVSESSGVISVMLSGGTAGTDYRIRIEFDTAAGLTAQYTGIVKVRER